MKLKRTIRWHNRLLDATTLSLNAGMVFAAFATTFNPVAGLIAVGAAGLITAANQINLTASCDTPDASERGSRMCQAFSELAGLATPRYHEEKVDNGLGYNDNDHILIDRVFSATAPTPQLGAVIGHEVGHSFYGHAAGIMNRLLTFTPIIGACAVTLASPWLGIAGTLFGLAAMTGTAVSGFLLTQIQQRQEEYACDRVAVIVAGGRAMGDALTVRSGYMSEPKLIRRLQSKCKPDSLAEQVINLLDSHPPEHRRRRAMAAFARQLGDSHDSKAEQALEQMFGKLARHKPEQQPAAASFRFNY